ncbi:MAG: hypothetical protein KKA54_20555 [Proteobacteria bacterium]|nr:hypothetical protein [Pseudomonadota bacterium]MBU0968759.1 hypothetical protein [Pseudomonadota bacterium]
MASSGQFFSLLLSLPYFLDAGRLFFGREKSRPQATARPGFHHLLLSSSKIILGIYVSGASFSLLCMFVRVYDKRDAGCCQLSPGNEKSLKKGDQKKILNRK